MPKTYCLAILAICLTVPSAVAGEGQPSPGKTMLIVDALPLQGPVEGLEPEVLDFRYAPGRWQSGLGLPDDPYKTIIGGDGGLYWDYGQRGPGQYHNGQGSFGMRVLAELVADGERGPLPAAAARSPHAPLVVTEPKEGRRDLAPAGSVGRNDRGPVRSSSDGGRRGSTSCR